MISGYYIQLPELIEIERTIHECTLVLESYHPKRILTEAIDVKKEANDIKNKATTALKRLYEMIRNLVNKFRAIAKEMVLRNKEWIEKVKNFDISKVKTDKIEIETFPYWNGIRYIMNVKIPEFNDNLIEDLKDPAAFRSKYFNKFVDDSGNIAKAKNMFRGSDEKVLLKGSKIVTSYPKMVSIAVDYERNYRKVASDTDMILKTLKEYGRDLESTDLHESALMDFTIFSDDKMISLLEAADGETPTGPTTSDDVEAGDDGKVIDFNKRKEEKEKASKSKSTIEALSVWARECYAINAMRMHVLEEGYDTCINNIAKLTKTKTQKKSDENNPDKEKDNTK